ncbi:hypothetical protein ACFVYD_34415 [Streptomyces sp. NPDC058301]|uniref:hypothetical protein n=1 Tax=Streptomyces sp. NPDC058301 TaxID=3346436 RepID=UPI0036E24E40
MSIPDEAHAAADRVLIERCQTHHVPKKHVERLERPESHGSALTGNQADTPEPVEVKLGMFLDNTRRRAPKLAEQRRNDLDQPGMRW